MKSKKRIYKSFVLPAALILGYIFREVCATLSVAVPYVIFAILFLTFSGVRLASLRPTKFDLILALFQALVSIGLFGLIISASSNEIIAQGAMMCVLCPVASSVTVVASMLGADARRTTCYTIVGNLLVAIIAPIYITGILGAESGRTLIESFGLIFCKIALVIALPFFLVGLMQRYSPTLNAKASSIKGLSFYLWAFALLVTIGQTIDFVISRWSESREVVLWLGLFSSAICVLQFSVGRFIGRRCGDVVAGGQLLAQKNSAMGIWILNTFLNPIASVALAFYSIWQNIYNSYQIFKASK